MDRVVAHGPACEMCGHEEWLYYRAGRKSTGARAQCTRCKTVHKGLRPKEFTYACLLIAHERWAPRSKRARRPREIRQRLVEYCRRTGKSFAAARDEAVLKFLEAEGA